MSAHNYQDNNSNLAQIAWNWHLSGLYKQYRSQYWEVGVMIILIMNRYKNQCDGYGIA